jgi:cytoskeletal protein RodZ
MKSSLMEVTRMKFRKTTLLVIAAILLWGAVAVWNGLQKDRAGNSTTNAPSPRANIATH